MKKIELKELSAYLPYKVKARFKMIEKARCRATVIGTVGAVYDGTEGPTIVCYDTVNASPDKFKLLLRPMSELTAEKTSDMNLDLMTQMEIWDIRDKHKGYWSAEYKTIQILLEGHYDVFNLLDIGAAEPIKD